MIGGFPANLSIDEVRASGGTTRGLGPEPSPGRVRPLAQANRCDATQEHVRGIHESAVRGYLPIRWTVASGFWEPKVHTGEDRSQFVVGGLGTSPGGAQILRTHLVGGDVMVQGGSNQPD